MGLTHRLSGFICPLLGGLGGGGGGFATTATGATVSTTTQGGGVAGGRQYTFKELEDQVQKWSVELQSQEKIFLREAQRINSWDRLLAENGDKVTDRVSEPGGEGVG